MAGVDDGGRCLMDEINALFAPPGRGDAKKRAETASKTELHPYYKRPGKGHNHDCCDACGEGGDLICCDSCPASFHLTCHCPPLVEEDIPTGDWICLRCYHRDESRLATVNSKINFGNSASYLLPESQPEFEANSETNSVTSESAEQLTENDDYREYSLPYNWKKLGRRRQQNMSQGKKTWDIYVIAPCGKKLRSNPEIDKYLSENPDVQIDREVTNTSKPSDLALSGILPASNGGRGGGSGRGRGGNRRPEISEADKTKVKLYKHKYEKYLKLKPITNSPFDILVKAAQVTNAEEFKLPQELHPHENLPFSWKWKEERRDGNDTFPKNCAVCGKTSRGVPSVSCDFCPLVYHLDCLDPPLCEIPTDRWMCPNHVEQFIDSKLVKSTRLSERMDLWKKYARNPINVETVRLEFFRKVRSGKLFQKSRTLKAQRPENYRMKVPQFIKNSYKKRNLTGFPVEHSEILLKKRRISGRNLEEDEEEWIKGLVALQSSLAEDKMVNMTAIKSKKLIRKPMKMVADHDDSTDSECELDYDITDEISVEAQEQIAKYLTEKHGQQITNLKPKIRDFLAAKKLNDIFNKDPAKDLNVRARAVLIPLDMKKRTSCPLTFRTFKVGQGCSVDLDLASYGYCQYVSQFHASIFFDQYSRIFELINYSEHGTVVDNNIYCGDMSITTVQKGEQKNLSNLKRMSRDAFKTNKDLTCFCTSSPAELNYERGCEVSAVLHHGSYVRFGCLQFVLSILSYENEEIKEEEQEEVEEKTTEPDTEMIKKESEEM